MSSTNSAPSSQKHCKKQLTSFLSSNSSSSSLNSNAKVEVSVNNYTFTKSSIRPPEISTSCLPTVSKHIKQTLQSRNQPSYTVKLPNTSKSLPIQTKLGAYFKSIAENDTKTNPSLRPMQYSRSHAMFKLGAKITKTNICSKPFSSTSSSSSVSTKSPESNKSPSMSASTSQMSFWSHSSTDSSLSNPHEDILIRDERNFQPSSLSHHFASYESDSSDTSKQESTSVFTPPSLSQHHHKSSIITRAQKHTVLPNSIQSDILSTASVSTQSPLLLLPVFNSIRSDRESSVDCPDLLPHPPVASSHINSKASLSSTASPPSASLHTNSQHQALLPQAITGLPPGFSSSIPQKELSRVQQLLLEISSNTSEIQSLRSEYERRKEFIDTTIEELTLESDFSMITPRDVHLHQSLPSESTLSLPTTQTDDQSSKKTMASTRSQKYSNLHFASSKDDSLLPTSKESSAESSLSPPCSSIPNEIKCIHSSPRPEEPNGRESKYTPNLHQRGTTFVDHILNDQYITQASSTTSSSSFLHSSQASQSLQEVSPPPNPPPSSIHTEYSSTSPVDVSQIPLLSPPTMIPGVSQNPSNAPIVTPAVARKLDAPVNKQKHSVRLIAQNCRGAFHSSMKHTDFYIPSMESLQGYSPDILCLCETNTDWNVKDNGYDADLMNRAIWNPVPTKTVVASCRWKNLQRTTYQPGGVLSTCMNSMPSRIKTTYRDPYGRFVKIIYQAKGNRDVSIYNIYRPNPGSTTTSGINTVWMQQWRCLRDKHSPCDPRNLCISHLIDEIQKDLEKNIHPILVGDFNEDLAQESTEGIHKLMKSCNMVQAFKELVGFVPSSRHNNRSVFHIFVFQPLLKYVLKLGVLPSEIGFHTSDHVPFFVDFHQDLFNYKESPIVPPNLRKLKMYDSPSVEKYICYVKNQMQHHNIIQRFLNLKDYIKIESFDASAEQEIELLDDQMTQIRLRAEKRLCPDPSRFKNASKMQIQVHRIRHLVSIQKFWKAGLDFTHLVRELKSYGLEDTDLTSLIKLQERISKERVDLKFLHEEEDVVRIDHLNYLYEKAIEIQNKQKAAIIKNMKMRENQKRSWAKIRYVTKGGSNRNVERLGIPRGFENKSTEAIWNYLSTPGISPTFTYINDQEAIEKRLIEWQYQHYGQAKETPLASSYWHDKLNPLKKSNQVAIAIANISYFKCKYIEHTSRGSTHTLALYLGLVMFFI